MFFKNENEYIKENLVFRYDFWDFVNSFLD